MPGTPSHENRLVLIVTGIVTTVLGTIIVFLRAWSVYRKLRVRGWDDIAMALAWIFSIGFTLSSYLSVRWGVGLDVTEVTISQVTSAVKAVYAIEIFYYLSIYCIKMSLLALYLRLAGGQSTAFGKMTIATIAVVTVHFLSTMVVVGVQCIPMEKYWDPATPGHCINITAFFYSTNCFTILSDLVILTIPIKTLWQMNRPRGQRIAICGAFLAGAISTIASCIRLYSIRIYTFSHEPLRDAAPINTWSFIEINLGILCASGPALRSLWPRAIDSAKGSSFGSYTVGSGRPGKNSKASGQDQYDLNEFATLAGHDEEEGEESYNGLAQHPHQDPVQDLNGKQRGAALSEG